MASAKPQEPSRPLVPPHLRLEDVLGQGAGSSVWRARDVERGRPVAVKVLPQGADLAEFAALRQLQHPGVVEVLEVGVDRTQRPWFTMELLEGRPFGGKRLLIDRWLPLTARFLEALSFLHERGWLHGDLKPDHVLVPRDHAERAERIVLIDFGLSLAHGEEGTLRGTLGWIAPEVLNGSPVSVASDLFAAGLVAASALLGIRDFARDSTEPGLGANEELEHASGLPTAVVGWLASLLRRDPALRPRSAREALSALEAAVSHPLLPPRAASERLAPTRLLGRDELLRRLAASRSSRAVRVLAGDPGAGRTSLLRALQDRVQVHGRSCRLLGLGPDPEAGHGRLRTLLERRSLAVPRPPDPTVLDEATLAQALPDYRARLAEGLQELFGELDILLVDDLDPETLAGSAVIDALRSMEDRPALVVACEGGLSGLVEDELGTLGTIEVIELPTLVERDVARWLNQSLGPINRTRDLARHLQQRSRGVPGRLHEITAHLVDRGAIFPGEREWRWDSGAVAEGLLDFDEVSQAHLPAVLDLPDAARDAVEHAQQTAAQGEFARARRRLSRALSQLTARGAAAGLLIPVWQERARLAQVLGDTRAAAADLRRVSRPSTEAPDDVRARALAREAEMLQGAGEDQAALELLEANQQLIEARGGPDAIARALLARGSALRAIGRHDEALEVARRFEDTDMPTHWRVSLAIVAANALWSRGQAAEAVDMALRARKILADGPSVEQAAVVHATLGTALRIQGKMDEAVVELEAARVAFRKVGRALDMGRIANNLGICQYLRGDWPAALDAFEEFRGVVQRTGNVPELVNSLNNLGCLYRDTGDLDRAGQNLERCLALTRKHGFVRQEAMALGNLAECAAARVRMVQAEDIYRQCLALSDEHGFHDEATEAWRRIAQLRLDCGDLGGFRVAAARAHEEAAQCDAEGEERLLAGLAAVARVRTGEIDAGVEEADAIMEKLGRAGRFERARLALRLAEALARQERPAEAGELLDMAEPVFRQLPARVELARIEMLRGSLAAATRNALDEVSAQVDVLKRLAVALSQETDLERLLEQVLDQALRRAGEERGYVLLLDEAGNPTVSATRDVGAERIELDLHGPSSSVTSRVIATKKPLAVLDIADHQSLGQARSIMAAGLRAVFCVPILRGEELLGVIYVDGRTAIGDAGKTRAALLMACADAASIAVENARLIRALNQKNDTIAVMAHELRTPISAIVGFTSVMAKEAAGASPALQEIAGIIRSQAERVNAMVNEVLELARMEAGTLKFTVGPVDPLDILVAAKDTVWHVAAQAGVAIDADADEELPIVLGHRNRMIQVLVNLLSNSVKFSPEGSTVSIHAGQSPEGWLRFVVEDEGPGIPKERLESIFEPYQQAGARDMRAKGVGLGLAITRQIVRGHGGVISASNRSRRGARFVVDLPPPPSLSTTDLDVTDLAALGT